MTRRVKNSLAERRLLLDLKPYPGVRGYTPIDFGSYKLEKLTGRTITDLKPQSLTYETLMETKRQFEEMEIGNSYLAFPDFSQIERRITASMGIDRNLHFWRPGAEAWPIYEPPRITTHKYEEHRQKVKAMQEAQAAERTRKSYEELFV